MELRWNGTGRSEDIKREERKCFERKCYTGFGEITEIGDRSVAKVWKYLKQKDLITAKIFYLYFAVDLKITEISKDLELNESNIKNRIYRTLKELKRYLGKDVDRND